MDQMITNVLPVAIAIGAAVGMMWMLARPLKSRLQSIASILDGSSSVLSGSFSPRLRGSFHGRPSEVWFERGSRSGPRRLNIVTHCADDVPFCAQAKGLASLIHLGFGRRTKTGVVRLDDEHAFFSPEPERFSAWMARSDEARGALEQLLRFRGVSKLTVRNGSARAEIERYSDEDASPQGVAAVLESIERLSRSAGI